MKSIIIILFAVLSLSSIQAQEGEPKEKKIGSLSFKNNEVFKRFGVFATANALYYHSNFGIGFDCFLIKNININAEFALGDSYGQVYGVDNNDKYWNGKLSFGLKYWPIIEKTNNNIYPYIGLNLASSTLELSIDETRISTIIETPIGLCYYKDGLQLSAHVGSYMEGKWGLKNLTKRDIYPFISFQIGFRF